MWKMRLIILALISPASTLAQLGPASSSSTSLGLAPTESIGCVVVAGEWQCAAPRQTASSSTSTTPSSTTTSSGDSTEDQTSGSVPAPPAESTGCVLHNDHYHCEGPAEGYTGTPTTDSPTIPSPTESSNCFWHETHWDCFESEEEAQEAQGADELGGMYHSW